MKMILAVGAPGADHETVFATLVKAGVSTAQPSRRDGHTPQALGQLLLEALEVDPATQFPVEQLRPGDVWQRLAADLVLANLEQPVWGWADHRLAWLLDFWQEFDPQVRLLLVYSGPAEHLMFRAQRRRDLSPSDVEGMLGEWVEWNSALLRYQLRNPQRSLLVNAQAALASPDALTRLLQEGWGLLNNLQAPPAAQGEGHPWGVLVHAAHGLIPPNHEAWSLEQELHHAAHLPAAGIRGPSRDAGAAWTAACDLVSECEAEALAQSGQVAAVLEENEQVQLRLQQVQEELELNIQRQQQASRNAEQLQNRCAKLELEVEAQRSKAQQAEDQRGAAVTALASAKEAWQREMAEASRTAEQFKEQCAKLQVEVEAQRSKAQQAEDQRGAAVTALASAKEGWQREKAEQARNKAEQTGQLAQLRSELQELATRRHAAEELAKQLERHCGDLQVEARAAEARHARLAEEQGRAAAEALNAAQATWSQERSELLKAYDAATVQVATHLAKIDQHLRGEEAAKQLLEQAHQRAEQLEAELNTERSRAEQLHQRCLQIQTQLEGYVRQAEQERKTAAAALQAARNGWATERDSLKKALDETIRQVAKEAAKPALAPIVDELKQENELLLQQLHQVQEEMERYFLQCQELQQGHHPGGSFAADFWKTHQPDVLSLDLRRQIAGDHWHDAEADGRWTGPAPISTLDLPPLQSGAYTLELDVVDAMAPDILASAEVELQGHQFPLSVEYLGGSGGFPAVCSTTVAVNGASGDGPLQLSLRLPRTVSPADHGSPDHRQLGLRVQQLRLIRQGDAPMGD